ncbi:MAG TPA: PAS domain S-box protein [Euryarchaeota archaeon]|nr:sensor protein kinase WalK [archaeon BMS3Bbin15]HDL15202.1 PAS domain S-box protein [Euryarchaeota archaeon]
MGFIFQEVDEDGFLKDMLNYLEEGLIIIDLDYNVIEANPAALELFGYKKEELIGRKCYESCHGEKEPCKIICPVEKVPEIGEIKRAIHEHIRNSGDKWISKISAAPVRNKQGDIVAVVEINTDITNSGVADKKIEHLKSVLQAITEVNTVITREENVTELLKEVCDILYRVRGYRLVWIDSIKEDTEGVVPVAKAGFEYKPYSSYPMKDACNIAVKTKKPQILKSKYEETGNRLSSAVIPVIYEDRVLYTINVCSDRAEVFTENEINLLMQIGRDIAFALKVMKEKEETKYILPQRIVVAKIGELFVNGAEIETLMQTAVELVAEVMDVEFSKILWLEGNKLRLIAGTGWPPDTVGKAEVGVGLESQAGYTLQMKKAVVVENFDEEKRFRAPRLLSDNFIVSGISLPMKYGDKVYGVIGVHSKQKRKYSQADVDFLSSIASLLTAAAEHRRSEEAVRRSQKKLREFFQELGSIMHTVPAAVLTTDGSGLINFINRRTLKYLGKGENDIIRSYIWEHFKEDIVKNIVIDILRGNVENEPVNLDATLKSGKNVELAISSLRNHSGEIDGIVASALDITPVKEAHRELEKAYEQLRSVDILKNNIIANVRHEILTPVTVMKGTLELLEGEVKDEGNIKMIKISKKYLQKLSEIVDNLVAVSSFYRGKVNINFKDIDLMTLVENTVSRKKTLAREKKVKIILHLGNNLPIIVGDEDNLSRALLNILDNAIKFNREGGKVEISVKSLRNKVVIRIKDTGVGMPKERLDEIFKPLTQLDASTKRRYSGTGMGLAVAKKIIELHSGKLFVESKLDKGTTFWFDLPVK